MEDYGYTFEDLSKMTRSQRLFIIKSKVERMKLENEAMQKAQEEAKKNSKRRKGSYIGPRKISRRR